MEKKYNPSEYNNPIPCEVCGSLTFADDYGNSDKCPHCGWMGCPENDFLDKRRGISYPMLVPLSRAREQYKAGRKFKATYEDFINGLKFYKEMLFWYGGKYYAVFYREKGISLESRESETNYDNIYDFTENANINEQRLKDIWDEVIHPCFMYCAASEEDYDNPPEE